MPDHATKAAAPVELRDPLARSVVSLLIVLHLFCLAFVLSANVNPSRLQARLAGVLAPYTQLLHLDPGGARLQFTDGSPLSNDHEIVVSPKLSDGTIDESNAIRLPDVQGQWSPERRRLVALAGEMAAYAEREDLVGLFARAMGRHVMESHELEHVVVRVRHPAVEPLYEDLPPDELLRDRVVYEAEVWSDPELGLQMQKRASGLGAAPAATSGSGGTR